MLRGALRALSVARPRVHEMWPAVASRPRTCGTAVAVVPVRLAKAAERGVREANSAIKRRDMTTDGLVSWPRVAALAAAIAALFGIPLQQQWSYGNMGSFAPTGDFVLLLSP
jgi:hypothetical protein